MDEILVLDRRVSSLDMTQELEEGKYAKLLQYKHRELVYHLLISIMATVSTQSEMEGGDGTVLNHFIIFYPQVLELKIHQQGVASFLKYRIYMLGMYIFDRDALIVHYIFSSVCCKEKT